MTMYQKGQRVLHISRGVAWEAIILAVHLDDIIPYYTIRIIGDGKEKQTDNDHIRPIHRESLEQTIGVNRKHPVQKRRCNKEYPMQKQYGIDSLAQMSSSSGDEDETNKEPTSGVDGNVHSLARFLKHQQQNGRSPVPILKASSYGSTPYNDIKNGDEVYYMYSGSNSGHEVVDMPGNNLSNLASNENNEFREASASRVRFNPVHSVRTFITDNDIDAAKHMVSLKPKKTRSPSVKGPSLLRPPIDRRYFTRIKRRRVGIDSGITKVKTVQTSNDMPLAGSIFRNEDSDSIRFNKQSRLYDEVTRKARVCKKAKQHQGLSCE